MEGIIATALVMAIPIIAIWTNYLHRVKKMEHERLQMQHQIAMLNPAAAANVQANADSLRVVQQLSTQLGDVTKQLGRVNDRLQNLESIVTSPGFLEAQGLRSDFHTLTEEQQAAELAKQIAAREGRLS